eukprot:scaffold141171_cov14-Tisochrysis_lutea.AAC.1
MSLGYSCFEKRKLPTTCAGSSGFIDIIDMMCMRFRGNASKSRSRMNKVVLSTGFDPKQNLVLPEYISIGKSFDLISQRLRVQVSPRALEYFT